jgi:adenine phosphoribosyltransferase
MSVHALTQAIRDIPDFPKPGILFKDITPILLDPNLFRSAVRLFVDRHRGRPVDKIAAIEARGFIFGAAVAQSLGVGLVPVRKRGKLPWQTMAASYSLEYGEATLEIHRDAVAPGERVLLIDDLLATGGTAAATVSLIEGLGGEVAEADFLIELAFLHGRRRLAGCKVFAPILF